MKNYVIERMNELIREWWTGEDWSDVDTDAMWMTAADARHLAEQVGGTVTYFE